MKEGSVTENAGAAPKERRDGTLPLVPAGRSRCSLWTLTSAPASASDHPREVFLRILNAYE